MEAKEIKSLMEAYASVYENQEQIDEYAQGGGGAAPNVPPAVHKFVDELPQKASKFFQTITGAAKPKPKEKPVKEENLFDIIKGHLMSEGYADTEEAALKIMANMSEEWRQSIVEGVAERTARAVDNQRQGYYGDDHALDKLTKDASASVRRLTRPKGPVVTPGLPGV